MAEVVGLLASVMTLGEMAFKIMGYLQTARDGGHARDKLHVEITSVWLLMARLKEQLQLKDGNSNGLAREKAQQGEQQVQTWQKALGALDADESTGIFKRLEEELRELDSRMTKTSSSVGKALMTLTWPLNEKYVASLISRIIALKAEITLVLTQSNHAMNKEILHDVGYVKAKARETQNIAIAEWLCPLDHRQRQRKLLASAVVGKSLIQDPNFKSWRDNHSRRRMRWHFGMPGAGKSIHAALAFANIEAEYPSFDAGVFVIYIQSDVEASQSATGINTAILKQALQTRDIMPEALTESFVQNHAGRVPPSSELVEEVLGEELAAYERVSWSLTVWTRRRMRKPAQTFSQRSIRYLTRSKSSSHPARYRTLIVPYQAQLLTLLAMYAKLQKWASIIAASTAKNYWSVKTASPRVEFKPAQQDMGAYVRRRIDRDSTLKQLTKNNSSLLDMIVTQVLQNSEDLFLLVRMHMDTLTDCVTAADVKISLQSLKPDVKEACSETLGRMRQTLKPGKWQATQNLLMWVVMAQRRLTVTEVGQAMAIASLPSSTRIEEESVPQVWSVVSWCGGLVTIDGTNAVHLIHPSIGRYFQEHMDELFPLGQKTIAVACLNYLNLDKLQKPCEGSTRVALWKLRSEKHPLLAYAAQYWGEHVRLSNDEIPLHQARALLVNEVSRHAVYQAMCFADRDWTSERKASALHGAAHFGLDSMVAVMVKGGENVNVLDGLGATPLMYAATRGHLPMIDKLLRSGARADVVCRLGTTALTRAIRKVKLDVAERLLDEEHIAINAIDHEGYSSRKNALNLALEGRLARQQLLDRRLTRDDLSLGPYSDYVDHRTALIHACVMKLPAGIVSKLIAKKPDLLETTGPGRWTALTYAVRHGNVDNLNVLLDAGAKIDHRDSQKATALMRAIDWNRVSAARVLLARGASWNEHDRYGRTLLHAAAINGRHEALKFLLDENEGLDVDVQDKDGMTPLHDAVRKRHEHCVSILASARARCDIPDKLGQTAYRMAKEQDSDVILRALSTAEGHAVMAGTLAPTNKPLLLSIPWESDDAIKERLVHASKDDINQLGTIWDRSAIHRAAIAGRTNLVKMLVEAGANVNARDNWSATPLSMAIERNNRPLVKLLISLGADVNIRKSPGSLWEVAFNGNHDHIAMMLIEAGAELRSDYKWFGVALHRSIQLNFPLATRRLLEHGADPEHKWVGQNAWQRVEEKNNKELNRVFDDYFKLQRVASLALKESQRIGHQTIQDEGYEGPSPDAFERNDKDSSVLERDEDISEAPVDVCTTQAEAHQDAIWTLDGDDTGTVISRTAVVSLSAFWLCMCLYMLIA